MLQLRCFSRLMAPTRTDDQKLERGAAFDAMDHRDRQIAASPAGELAYALTAALFRIRPLGEQRAAGYAASRQRPPR